MKKQTILAVLSTTTLVAAGAITLTAIDGGSIFSNAGSNTHYLTLDKTLTPNQDGIVTVNTNGGAPLQLKITDYVDAGTNVVALKAGGTIENISPVQNISKLFVAGKSDNVEINGSMWHDAFKLDYGFVTDAETGTGKLFAKHDLYMKAEYGINEAPSYFKLTATKDTTLTKLGFDYSCVNETGKHTALPTHYTCETVKLMGINGDWATGVPFTAVDKFNHEWTLTTKIDANTIIKAQVNNSWDWKVGKDYFGGEAFTAGQIAYQGNEGDMKVNETATYTIHYRVNDGGWIEKGTAIPAATLKDAAGLTFKDGTASKELTEGAKLTLDDFDTSKVADGRTLIGFSVNGGKAVTALDKFVMGKEACTLTPVFGKRAGFTEIYLTKSNSGAKINFPKECHGSFVTFQTMKHTYNTAVRGGDGAVELGERIIEKSPVDFDSQVRFDLSSLGIADKSGIKEFRYNIENFSNEELHLNLYQIGGYTEHASGYLNRYRIDVDLLPGESATYMGQYKLGVNDGGNELCYVIADSNANGLDFGISFSAKVTDLTEVATKNVAEAVTKTNIVFTPLKGFKVLDTYAKTVDARTKLVLPTAEQIENTSGKVFGGYATKVLGQLVPATNGLLVPTKELILIPYYVEEGAEMLLPGSGCKGVDGADYLGSANLSTGKGENKNIGYNLVREYDYTTFEMPASRIHSNGHAVAKNAYFRMLTKSAPTAVVAGTTYKFHFTMKNNASEDLAFILSIGQSSKDWGCNNAVKTENLTLKAGATTDFNITITLKGNNGNVMPHLVVLNAMSSLDFTMAMARTIVK